MSAVCSCPLRGYWFKGKIVFDPPPLVNPASWIPLPCGKCFSCSIARPSSMAVRMVLESLDHEITAFVTPTYSDQFLPPHGELVPVDMRNFIRRVRRYMRRHPEWNVCGDVRLRNVHAGERGELRGRPHFHGVFYSFWPSDAKAYGKGDLFSSPVLDDLWGKGQCLFGVANTGSFEYVARYSLKATAGTKDSLQTVDRLTGEAIELRAPFARYSSQPGIGAAWLEKFGLQYLGPDSDYIVIEGQKRSVPRYYIEKLKAVNPALAEAMLAARVAKASSPDVRWNSSPERLRVREVVLKAKMGIHGGIAKAGPL